MKTTKLCFETNLEYANRVTAEREVELRDPSWLATERELNLDDPEAHLAWLDQ